MPKFSFSYSKDAPRRALTCWGYRGFNIALTRDGEFFIEGDDFVMRDVRGGASAIFPTLDAAGDAIDTFIKKNASEEIKKTSICVSVLDDAGVEMTINGLHRGTSEALVSGYKQPRYKGDIYPNLPWVRDALVERQQIRERLTHLNMRLSGLSVHAGRGYSSQITAERYPGRIKNLKNSLTTCKEKAEERTDDSWRPEDEEEDEDYEA